jgi:hypothetical protein
LVVGRADRPNFGPVSSASRDSHANYEFVTLLLAAMTGCTRGEPEASMSARNGDRARFHKDRKRKLRHRQRIQEFTKALRGQPAARPNQDDKASGR